MTNDFQLRPPEEPEEPEDGFIERTLNIDNIPPSPPSRLNIDTEFSSNPSAEYEDKRRTNWRDTIDKK